MKSISGKYLCKLLEKRDWQVKKIHGSHYVYMKAGRKERISVPVHGNKDLKIGMAKAIMKLAGIDESEL
ncbi:MAG: type II toxin-antitoxin system HicA family toxin [Deltaproteobacteria bacterium]|nr:type II toxin-antitoxin system HicA family toxin [Deltaproteobacteria bacterium]